VPVIEYTPRDPSASVIYAVVQAHVEGFLAEATRLRHLGLPTEVPPRTPARAPPSIDDWTA
jgi:hypothetical protein